MDATMPHSATSESEKGKYRAGAVGGVSFDTGIIQGNSQGTFTVPANATVGTTAYYFCTIHAAAMANEPHLTVVP
jgi:hypothetical protein